MSEDAGEKSEKVDDSRGMPANIGKLQGLWDKLGEHRRTSAAVAPWR